MDLARGWSPHCPGAMGILEKKNQYTLQGTDIFLPKDGHFEDDDLNHFSKLPQVFSFSKRWDMLIPWRVFHICNKNRIIVALVLG